MRTTLIRATFFSLLFAALPAGLTAQQGGIDPAQLPPEAQELISELQRLQAQLQPIQQEAFEDPAIQAAQQALAADVQEAMAVVDPATPERMERLEALVAQAQVAQAEQDAAAMNEIVTEARGIEEQLQATQQAAIESAEIAPLLEAFEAQLLERMMEVDPNVESLIDRARELDARLAVVLDQGS